MTVLGAVAHGLGALAGTLRAGARPRLGVRATLADVPGSHRRRVQGNEGPALALAETYAAMACAATAWATLGDVHASSSTCRARRPLRARSRPRPAQGLAHLALAAAGGLTLAHLATAVPASSGHLERLTAALRAIT